MSSDNKRNMWFGHFLNSQKSVQIPIQYQFNTLSAIVNKYLFYPRYLYLNV